MEVSDHGVCLCYMEISHSARTAHDCLKGPLCVCVVIAMQIFYFINENLDFDPLVLRTLAAFVDECCLGALAGCFQTVNGCSSSQAGLVLPPSPLKDLRVGHFAVGAKS